MSQLRIEHEQRLAAEARVRDIECELGTMEKRHAEQLRMLLGDRDRLELALAAERARSAAAVAEMRETCAVVAADSGKLGCDDIAQDIRALPLPDGGAMLRRMERLEAFVAAWDAWSASADGWTIQTNPTPKKGDGSTARALAAARGALAAALDEEER